MFIDEIWRYLRRMFEGVKDRTMSDHIVEEIAGSAEKVSAAMQVISLADSIRQRLLSDLGQQLRAKCPHHNIVVSDNPWARYSGLTIAFSAQCPYLFGMEFQNAQFNGLAIGLQRNVEKSPARADEYAALVRTFGAASQNDWWLWCRSASSTDSLLAVPQHWSSGGTADPWIDIPNGKLASKIVEAFERAHNVLNECGVG